MRRRWIGERRTETTAALVGSQAQHLTRVLRAQVGQRFEIALDSGVWLGRVSSITPEDVLFELEAPVSADAPLPLTFVLAVWKFDRFEWALEKLTELGVARVVPVIARRTDKHLAQAAAQRVERWRRIAGEAAQQSRRAAAPVIDAPRALHAALESERGAGKLLLSEHEQHTHLHAGLMTLAGSAPADTAAATTDAHEQLLCLAVGPEGGWAEQEHSLFLAEGWQPVSLGPRILRAETAAIAAAAIASAVLLSLSEQIGPLSS